jgi:hypothetical protein
MLAARVHEVRRIVGSIVSRCLSPMDRGTTSRVLGVVIISLLAVMGVRAWEHAYGRTPLLEEQRQLAGVLEQAVAQARQRGPGAVAEVAFSAGSSRLVPVGIDLPHVHLARGATVVYWRYPGGVVRIWVDPDGRLESTEGVVTIRMRNGRTGDVWMGRDGSVAF